MYHILCNTVYFIIKQAYGFLGEKKETSKSSCTPCILSPFFPSFWALSSKISFFQRTDIKSKCLVCGDIVYNFGMYQDPKQQNETTKTNQVKRLKRNDPENVDFTSDNLSHIMLLNIMAVSRNFIFFLHHTSSWNLNLTLICSFQDETPAKLNTKA